MLRDIFYILDPGPMTTVQDRGRYGFRKFGVPVSGALDTFSSAVANRLLGNKTDQPLLEMTFRGPRMSALDDCVIALTGALMPFSVNGVEKPQWASVRVRKGDIVNFGVTVKGVRAYLAVSGGIWSPEVMGSSSTFVAARLGGTNGRPLIAGDFVQSSSEIHSVKMTVLDEKLRPRLDNKAILRAVPGPQDDFFDEGLETFFSSEFVLSDKADRMGIRLQGPAIKFRNQSRMTIISEPNLPGCVQVPPDGQPIILLVEQTVGGYAKIAAIITSDLDLVAQLRPGDKVLFNKISLSQAHKVFQENQVKLQSLRFTNL